MQSMDDILEGKEEAPAKEPDPAPEPEAKAEAPAPEAQPEPTPEEGKEKEAQAEPEPKGEKQDGEPPSSKDQSIPIAAHLAEREKRQEAERTAREASEQLKAMQAQLDRLSRQQSQQNRPERPDPFEDPEGARRYDEAMLSQQFVDQKVNMSAEIAKQAFPDFDEVMQDWNGLARTDPAYFQSLYSTAVQQSNPAAWAYRKMKEMRVAREVGDPEDYRTKLREELAAEIRAEFEAEQKAAAEQRQQDAIPQSLAGERSAGNPRGSAWSGPTPMDQIIGE